MPLSTLSIIDEPQQSPLPLSKASDANPMTPDHLPQKSTRTSIGKIYDKDLGIWCDRLTKKKGPNKFFRMEQKKTWRHFCACTPYLKDQIMRERIVVLIALTPKDDLFANDIHYHKRCWDKYVSNANRSKRRDHAPGVPVTKVNAVFKKRYFVLASLGHLLSY